MSSGAESVLAAHDCVRIVDVLERCRAAADFPEFRSTLVAGIASAFRLRHVTFFTGPTLTAAFHDTQPSATGDLRGRLVSEYQRVWADHDVFATAPALHQLRTTGWVGLERLTAVECGRTSYVEGFLRRVGLESAHAFTFELPSRGCGLVGAFDPDPDAIGVGERKAIQALLRLAATIPYAIAADAPAGPVVEQANLTDRQREVVCLIARGLSNAQIATALGLAEDTVKKYVSRALAATGYRTRTELAIRQLRSN